MRDPGGENIGLEGVHKQEHQVVFARREGPDYRQVRAAIGATGSCSSYGLRHVRRKDQAGRSTPLTPSAVSGPAQVGK